MDGTKVGTCVGFGVGLRVGSGFGVGAGVGYFVGFAVLGAGVGFREGRGVGFFVNKYGFVRISCSMRSLPRRCCMRQRALRAASSAPHATSTTASARRMAAALFVFYLLSAEAPCTLPKRDAGVEKCRSQLALCSKAHGVGAIVSFYTLLAADGGLDLSGGGLCALPVWEVSRAMISVAIGDFR